MYLNSTLSTIPSASALDWLSVLSSYRRESERRTESQWLESRDCSHVYLQTCRATSKTTQPTNNNYFVVFNGLGGLRVMAVLQWIACLQIHTCGQSPHYKMRYTSCEGSHLCFVSVCKPGVTVPLPTYLLCPRADWSWAISSAPRTCRECRGDM